MSRRRKKQPRNQIPLAWPAELGDDVEYTDDEYLAILCHPMVTGVGSCPRVVADADYIEAMLKVIEEEGVDRFCGYMLRLLRATDHLCWAEPEERRPRQPVPEPLVPRSTLQLPMPTVEFAGGRNALSKWTPELIRGIALNPAYTGLRPFPAAIKPEVWITAFAAEMRREGPLQTMVNFLCVLRHTYGLDSVSAGRIPFGYRSEDMEL